MSKKNPSGTKKDTSKKCKNKNNKNQNEKPSKNRKFCGSIELYKNPKQSKKYVPLSVKLFVAFVGLAFIIAIIFLFFILPPSDSKIMSVIENFNKTGYEIPKLIAQRYLSYGSMRDFYLFLFYGFSIVSIVASAITVAYTVSRDETQHRNIKSSIAAFSIGTLIFVSLNMLINPRSIAVSTQHAFLQLEHAITSVIYDEGIDNNDKSIILMERLSEIEKEMKIKIYS